MNKIKRNSTAKGFEIVRIKQIYNGVIFYENRTDLHKADGFYDIIRPTKTELQKYGELTVADLNDATMEATYPIVDFTQEEIDAYNLELENRPIVELLQQFENDGIEFYNEVRELVKKHHLKGTITDNQFKGIRVTLEPALRPLKLGDWDIAQDNINAITRPSGTLALLYDFVKNKIDNYLS